VLIIEVIKGGFADRVGLKPGDVILGIDETDTPDIKTLKDVIRKKEPGMKLTINLIRHKRRFTISGIL
jgi:C-terminal processing protease CtpA/Prc